jgi:hypothetical protein
LNDAKVNNDNFHPQHYFLALAKIRKILVISDTLVLVVWENNAEEYLTLTSHEVHRLVQELLTA